MNMSIRHALAAVAALGAAVAIGGCSSSTTHGGSGHDQMPAMPSMSGSGSASPDAAASHNTADITFATHMIPHHQQAVVMADLALSQAASPQLKTMATEIKGAQNPEIQTMAGWLQSWGHPVPTGMAGMAGHSSMAGMEGMMTEQEMQQLQAAAGADFDRLWLRMMTTHHEGAVAMSTTELQQGKDPAAKALAQQIITAQNKEIAAMAQLLSTITG